MAGKVGFLLWEVGDSAVRGAEVPWNASKSGERKTPNVTLFIPTKAVPYMPPSTGRLLLLRFDFAADNDTAAIPALSLVKSARSVSRVSVSVLSHQGRPWCMCIAPLAGTKELQGSSGNPRHHLLPPLLSDIPEWIFNRYVDSVVLARKS